VSYKDSRFRYCFRLGFPVPGTANLTLGTGVLDPINCDESARFVSKLRRTGLGWRPGKGPGEQLAGVAKRQKCRFRAACFLSAI